MDSLYQLLTGDVAILIDGSIFFIKPFTAKIKQLASIYATKAYEEAFIQGCLTNDEIFDLSIELNEWSLEEEDLLESIPKNIEQMKLDYYHRFYYSDSKREIKNSIEKLETKVNDLYQKKFKYYQYTCEYHKSITFDNFCIERSLYNEFDESVNINNYNIGRIKYLFEKNKLDSKTIRGLSQSSEWREIWNASDKTIGIFNKTSSELSDSQLQLINWSKMYDSVYQSMDCPSEEIIKDDIAIDGWFIDQDRKRKEEDKKTKASSVLSKTKTNGDLFLPAKTQEEVDRIIEMNGPQGKNVIKSLASDLRNKGSLKESELTHVKNDIQMAINRRRK